MREIEEDTNICSWFGRINIVKMSILSKAICKFNSTSIKISMVLFHRNKKKKILKFVKDLEEPKQFRKRRTKLETPHLLILNYITKL